MTTSPMDLSESESESDGPAPTTNDNDLGLVSSINCYLLDLRKKHSLILRKEGSLARKRQKVAAQIDLFQKLALRALKPDEESGSAVGGGAKRGKGRVACEFNLPTSRWLVHPQLNLTAELMPNPIDNDTKGPRYLCVLNGYSICCLDLKLLGKEEPLSNAAVVPPFPKIATLNLLEEGLPVSSGLLKLGSHVYLIGGQKFPAAALENPGTHHFVKSGRNPKGFDLYRILCFTRGSRGTSRVAYRLSLADDGTTLSYSEAEGNQVGKLVEPKCWPIVEKVSGQIHVIESVPLGMENGALAGNVSHEALDSDQQWKRISSMEAEEQISKVIVVGDRMYTVGCTADWVFDSKREEWIGKPREIRFKAFNCRDVWDILDNGMARCGGQFPQGEGGSKSNHPLYVLVGVMREYRYTTPGTYVTYAVAYLVTSKGRVVCIQRLPHFFEESRQPYKMEDGAMIDVDEEEEEEGKSTTLCSIVSGSALVNGRMRGMEWMNYLFINTFCVEMLTDAVSQVGQLLSKKGRKAWPVELDFVRVHIRERYVYKTDAKLKKKEADLPGFAGLQACFL